MTSERQNKKMEAKLAKLETGQRTNTKATPSTLKSQEKQFGRTKTGREMDGKKSHCYWLMMWGTHFRKWRLNYVLHGMTLLTIVRSTKVTKSNGTP
jgi:hypothetical protein